MEDIEGGIFEAKFQKFRASWMFYHNEKERTVWKVAINYAIIDKPAEIRLWLRETAANYNYSISYSKELN